MATRPFKLRKYRTEGWQHYKVSTHFTLGEFIRDQREAPAASEVKRIAHFAGTVLEPLRERYGRCLIVSGKRSPTRNREVGGAPRSWHVWEFHEGGLAVDVVFARATPPIWAEAASKGRAGGIGTYRAHLHLDNGPRRYWSSDAA